MREVQHAANASIDVREVIRFFRQHRIIVASLCTTGLLCALIYLAITPAQYEAQLWLKMAQSSRNNDSITISINNGNVSVNSKTTSNSNISEEPEALAQRLRSPTTYTEVVRQNCGLQEEARLHHFLDRNLEAHAVKNSTTLFELKLRAASVSQARQCAESVVEMISSQQAKLIGEQMAGRGEQLERYQKAYQEEQKKLAVLSNNGLERFAYLAELDQLSWLRSRIGTLQEELNLSLKYPTKLTGPIFVSSKAVSPKVSITLLIGVLLGLMVGVLFASIRESMSRET